MPITQAALQQSLLSLLCFSQEHAPLLALRLKPESFIGRQAKLIAKAAIEYNSLYHQPPQKQLEFLLENELRRGEEGKLLGQTLDILRDQFLTIQPEFILAELELFEETNRITQIAQNALEELSQGNLLVAKEALAKISLSSQKALNDEIWLSDSKQMLSFLDKHDTEFFSTGIEAVDAVGTRPERKTLMFLIAPTRKGKSWFLVNCAKASLQYHKSPLCITLEMSAEKWARRLLQAIFSLTKDEAENIRAPFFVRDANGNHTIQFEMLSRDSILNRRNEIVRKLNEFMSYPPLVIKEFPSGSLTIGSLEAYLEYLKREKRFEPDIVLLDYAELMHLDPKNKRIDIGTLFVDLRGLATKRNTAIVTASQGDANSESAKTVDLTNFSEDWSKCGTADMILTYSQTDAENRLGLSRILIAKNRDATDRIMILNSQSYQIGQFSLDSIVMSRNVAQEVERMANGTV